MPKFSATSLAKLYTCDPELQRLFLQVVKSFDCTILEGHRDQEDQDRAFEEGKSQLRWPNGKHNPKPSRAIDVSPFPLDWNDTARFIYFAGVVMGTAAALKIPLRWGGDWDSDGNLKENRFDDLVHFELV